MSYVDRERGLWRRNFYDWIEHPDTGQPSGIVEFTGTQRRISNVQARVKTTSNSHPVNELKATAVVNIFENRRNEDHHQIQRELLRRGLKANFIAPSTYEPESDHCGWAFATRSVFAWGFLSAKKGADSEDAEPLFVHTSSHSSHRIFMGVFDGMGGAGAARTTGEHSYTEAYRASRILRASLLRDMSQLIPDALRIGRSKAIGAAEMAKRLSDDLIEVSKRPGLISTSRIRGTMTKTLPSTVATVEINFDDIPAGSTRPFVAKLRAMWAGDSRIWVLTPSRGLQQISKDDVDIEDCLEQIRQDPPMNNVASASVPFHLNEHEVSVNEPCIVIVATDGVFGYVRSPGEVELLILRAIANSSGDDALVGQNLFEEFRSIAKDDASAAVFACGFNSFVHCVDAFNLRKNRLADQYSTLDRIEEVDAFREAIENQWAIERIPYTSLMSGAV